MGAERNKSAHTAAYDVLLRERSRLTHWEAFILDVVSGARHLTQDKEVHDTKPSLASDYPSKKLYITTTHRDELVTYWKEVRKEVSKLSKLSLVHQWFGIPVRESAWGSDPNNWARYCTKVSHPMDLRTVSEKLGESGMPAVYTSPDQVTDDIRRIVSNCEIFNEGDAGDQVCKVARQLQNTWERRWQPDDGTGLRQKWVNLKAHHAAEIKALKWLEAAQQDQVQKRLHDFDIHVHKLLQETPGEALAAIPWELRRKVAVRISQLNDHNVSHLLQVVEHLQPHALRSAPCESGTEAVLDINELSAEALEKLQLFLDHLPVRKGKDDKKKRSVVKGKDGRFQSASAAPSAGATSAAPSAAPSGGPSAPGSAVTTPNYDSFYDPQATTPASASRGLHDLMHESPMHDVLMHDDSMNEMIDVS